MQLERQVSERVIGSCGNSLLLLLFPECIKQNNLLRKGEERMSYRFKESEKRCEIFMLGREK